MNSISRFLAWASLLSLLIFARTVPADEIRELQTEAIKQNKADWGHWGPDKGKFSSWTSHSNRLIPLYSFGMNLSSVSGSNSVYRDKERLQELYGYLPDGTWNPKAEYFDQTDVWRLQKLAAKQGKTCIVLLIFDGMDWETTLAASIVKSKRVAYREGRGTGLHFQDYRGVNSDFGFFVTSPHNEGTTVDVNQQQVKSSGDLRGGYDPQSGGNTPWDAVTDPNYPIGKGARFKHAYTDSGSAAASMTCGIKTYNNAINVDALGRKFLPIARQLQENGYAVGVVTSVPISHATPACAYVNNVDRDDYQDLTRDMLGLPSIAHPGSPLPGMDVVLGAGWGESKEKDNAQGDNFVAGNRYLAVPDLAAIDAKNGGKYEVCQRTTGKDGGAVLADSAKLAIESKHRLLGFFGVKGGHLPFQTADGKYDPTINVNDSTIKVESYSPADVSENPTLAEMSTTALDVLAARSDRFWLMVEAGDVDWANHQNNIDNSIGAVLSGDEAFHAMTDWIEKHVGWEKSVVLVTSDHGHYLVLERPDALIPKSRTSK